MELKIRQKWTIVCARSPLLLLYFNEAVASKELSMHVQNGYEVGAAA